jgi:hypothetical protein
MVELRHGRVRMDVRINQAGQYHLSLKINERPRNNSSDSFQIKFPGSAPPGSAGVPPASSKD